MPPSAIEKEPELGNGSQAEAPGMTPPTSALVLKEVLMPPLNRLKEFLDANRVAYEVMVHPTAYAAQQLAAVQHVKGKELAKVVVLRSGEAEFMMAVLAAPCRVDLGKAREATGKQDLAIAHESEFMKLFPGCEPGAMPPFGNLYGVPVWVDESLAKDEEIVFNACTHTQAIRMRFAEFARLANPRVATLRL
jgi:Ala-tRNA(Pro) deacylase